MHHRDLVSRSSVDKDHILVTLKVGFAKGNTFERNVTALLDAIGIRPETVTQEGAHHERLDLSLVHFDEEESLPTDLSRGVVEFAVPAAIIPPDCGLPLVLAVAAYGSAYSFVREFQVIDIDFPPAYLVDLPGPRYGDMLIQPRYGNTRLGLILKPRFLSDVAGVQKLVGELAPHGIDYVTDDELTVGTTRLPFGERVGAVMSALRPVEERLGRRIPYVANVTARYSTALRLSEEARKLGAGGVMVNTIAMGYDALTKLASGRKLEMGVFANSIGRGVLTSGPAYRVAPALLCKLARLAGADAVYTGTLAGSIDNVRQYAAAYRRALMEPCHRGCKRKTAGAVMSGAISLPELLQNEEGYKGPLYLSLGRGLVSPLTQGIPGRVVLESMVTIWQALRTDGLAAAQRAAADLARRGDSHKRCLELIRADEALAKGGLS